MLTRVLGTDRVIYRFYRRKKASPTIVVIVSLGVMFVMNGIVRLIIGPLCDHFGPRKAYTGLLLLGSVPVIGVARSDWSDEAFCQHAHDSILAAIPDADPKIEPLHRFANNPYNVFGVPYAPLRSITPFTYQVAGTTRDAVRETIQVEGIPLHIIDTAGLRDTDDVVESIGVARARRSTNGV